MVQDSSPGFQTTRWSVVAAAAADDSVAAHAALAVLCETYWYPLYAYLRRSGHTPPDAEDVAQGFFTRILAKRDIRGADPGRGRFRTYLLGALKHFLSHERERGRALKRGGGQPVLSIDYVDADRRYQLEASDRTGADAVFERHWALALLARAVDRVRAAYAARDQGALFEALRPALLGRDDDGSRERIASALGMEVGAVSTALHRLRRRFREALRAEVADTVADPTDIEDELQFLREVLTAGAGRRV